MAFWNDMSAVSWHVCAPTVDEKTNERELLKGGSQVATTDLVSACVTTYCTLKPSSSPILALTTCRGWVALLSAAAVVVAFQATQYYMPKVINIKVDMLILRLLLMLILRLLLHAETDRRGRTHQCFVLALP